MWRRRRSIRKATTKTNTMTVTMSTADSSGDPGQLAAIGGAAQYLYSTYA
jgi:hypothetical protein